MKPLRVLIVDDQLLVRDGIASLLKLRPEIDVVGTAGNGHRAVEAVTDLLPDVVLMDIRMPVMDGISAVEELRRGGSSVRILMLTTFDDEEYILKSLRAGANGYLMKDIPTDELARAIVQVYAGTYQVAPGVMDSLLQRIQQQMPHDGEITERDPETQHIWETFTDRERDVLRLLGQGASNIEIAREIHLSAGTVKNYVSEILSALDLRDRTQAALMAVKYGWDR